jgi:hypothetical protein
MILKNVYGRMFVLVGQQKQIMKWQDGKIATSCHFAFLPFSHFAN